MMRTVVLNQPRACQHDIVLPFKFSVDSKAKISSTQRVMAADDEPKFYHVMRQLEWYVHAKISERQQ